MQQQPNKRQKRLYSLVDAWNSAQLVFATVKADCSNQEIYWLRRRHSGGVMCRVFAQMSDTCRKSVVTVTIFDLPDRGRRQRHVR